MKIMLLAGLMITLPALVVAFTDAAGEQWIWVAGPDCGLVPGDVDELYKGPLA